MQFPNRILSLTLSNETLPPTVDGVSDYCIIHNDGRYDRRARRLGKRLRLSDVTVSQPGRTAEMASHTSLNTYSIYD